jgi:hypothetical protein
MPTTQSQPAHISHRLVAPCMSEAGLSASIHQPLRTPLPLAVTRFTQGPPHTRVPNNQRIRPRLNPDIASTRSPHPVILLRDNRDLAQRGAGAMVLSGPVRRALMARSSIGRPPVDPFDALSWRPRASASPLSPPSARFERKSLPYTGTGMAQGSLQLPSVRRSPARCRPRCGRATTR